MERWLHRIEAYIDKSIPYVAILLLIILGIHFLWKEVYEAYTKLFNGLDTFIVAIFTIDLIFKYRRVRNIPAFLKKYWLDILAIFPFYLVLRLVEEIVFLARLSGEITEGQKILHSELELERANVIKGLELERKAGKVAQEVEKIGEVSRAKGLFRIFAPSVRFVPRLAKLIGYYVRKEEKEKKKTPKKKSLK